MRQLINLPTLLLLSSMFFGMASTAQAQAGYGGFGQTLTTGDFNGDGYMDQAIANTSANEGSVLWSHSTFTMIGAVHIRYGSYQGMGTSLDRTFRTFEEGLLSGSSYSYIQFGNALAAGDFNGDGYEDLAIGTRYDRASNIKDSGAVVVLYGSMYGLRTYGKKKFHQDTPGIAGICEIGDMFGSSLTADDFNNDGRDDLVIGVPGEDIGSIKGAGMAHLLWGSSGGLTTAGDLSLHQNTSGVPNFCETGDAFGAVLTSGDFDGDGYPDLAVGVPNEDFSFGRNSAGIVQLFRGRSYGLIPSSTTISQVDLWAHVNGWDWSMESYDRFGTSLCAGDINNDGVDDLVIGTEEDLGTSVNLMDAGMVEVVLFKRGNGFRVQSQTQLHQNTPNISGGAEFQDHFGSSLVLGDLNNDGYEDLVIGVPFEDLGSIGNAGMVHILYGSSSGLRTYGSKSLHQNTSGVPDIAESDDRFGGALCIGDFNGDGHEDLAVSVSGENDSNPQTAKGVIQVFKGSTYGPLHNCTSYNSLYWQYAN